MRLLTATTWCITSWGSVASSPGLLKRTPQSSSSTGMAPSTSADPASPRTSPQTQGSLPSPSNITSSITFTVLAGASAAVSALAFFFIFRKYKGQSKLKKSEIRHVTHEEQKERYRSLFGVPAGYLRPQSQMASLVSQSVTHPAPVVGYSDHLQNIPATVEDYSIYPSSEKLQSSGTLPLEISQIEALGHQDGYTERKSIWFNKQSAQDTRNSTPNDNTKKLSHFSETLPTLASRLKAIKDKARCRGQSSNPTQIVLSTEENSQHSSGTSADMTEEDWDLPVPRSPSIIPTPPNYLKSPTHLDLEFEKPPDLGRLVTDRLESKMTTPRSSFQGRGDSYYWKVSPIVESPEM